MSQQNDQNRDREQKGEGYQDANDQSTRESRGGSQSEQQRPGQQENQPGSNQDMGSDLDDAEELDEDRDDDLRSNGGANRRNNIG